MKKTTKKIVHQTDTYHLTPEIKYLVKYENGKEISRALKYVGKNLHDYPLRALYKEDVSLLKKTNPFWGPAENHNWLNESELPPPEEIDLSKIILCQPSTHSFFDIEKKILPTVVQGDYIANFLDNWWYDLPKLRDHLQNHPNVLECSEILEIPYYNRETWRDKCLNVRILPTREMLEQLPKPTRVDLIWPVPYDRSSFDFFNMKQFLVKTETPW